MAKQRWGPTGRRDRKGAPVAGRRKSCQYCRGQGPVRRLQGRPGRFASSSRTAAGSGRAASGRVPAAPEPDRPGGERARELALTLRASARDSRLPRDRGGVTRNPIGSADHSRPRRSPQGHWASSATRFRSSTSRGLLARFLLPAQARRAGDRGLHRGGPTTPRRLADLSSPRPLPAPAGIRLPCSAAPCSRSPTRPATTAASSTPSLRRTSSDAISEARGLKLDRREVHLDDPIRTVGTRMVRGQGLAGVMATVKTMVIEQSYRGAPCSQTSSPRLCADSADRLCNNSPEQYMEDGEASSGRRMPA